MAKLSGKTKQVVNISLATAPNLRFIVDESEKWGRSAYFRYYRAGTAELESKEIQWLVSLMSLEALGALSHQLNIEFEQRLDKLKKESGF